VFAVVATDPYVPETLDAEPRQLPNLAPGVHLPPAGAWRAERPGDLVAGQPHGPLLGSPGPGIGYARLLVERRRDRFVLSASEHLDDAASVVAELAMRRAAALGRAPVIADIDVAMELLGYAGDVPSETPAWRFQLVDGAGHEYAKRRRIVDAVPGEVLRLPSDRVAAEVPAVRSAIEAAAAGLEPPAARG
jgi:hypothetical protein